MLKNKLQWLSQNEPESIFSNVRRGIEKESLRIDQQGQISRRSHPEALGAALTNPWVTTDFSEALIEVVTPPAKGLDASYNNLLAVSQFVAKGIDDELLWPSSMPCALGEARIPLADYGKTNVARMKKIYRQGLCHRYGRAMQVIAGIHYNFSLPKRFFQTMKHVDHCSGDEQAYVSDQYLKLVRNFFRYSWMLIYLFGAAPACADSSIIVPVDYLKSFGKSTHYSPFATSLRLSDLGYHNKDQDLLNISYHSVQDYADSLLQATKTPYKEFSEIGVHDVDGYKQLNDSQLQIENEYYNLIRPKQIVRSGERPAHALINRGVEYVEVRMLDLNPLEEIGISKTQMAFTDVFLTFCLLEDSPQFSDGEYKRCKENIHRVAVEGRKPGLRLLTLNGQRDFNDWAKTLFDQLITVAELMGDAIYLQAVRDQFEKLIDVRETPSAKVLSALDTEKLSFHEFNLNLANQHKQVMLAKKGDEQQEMLITTADESLKQFAALNAQPQQPFEEFLASYFSC